MQGQFWRYSAVVAGSMVMITLGSCKGRGASESAARNAETPAAADTGMQVMSADTAGTGSAKLSDPNIVALLDEANAADSAASHYALTKATSPDVKAFAKLMMGEHHALRAQGQQLAKRLNLTPELPANDPLKPAAQSEMTALQGAPKGAQFDRTYIEQEIGIHKAVLDLASKGHDQAQNADLKKLIEKAKPVIEKHLNKAEQIQKRLGGPTT